jgi:hypothetical protein
MTTGDCADSGLVKVMVVTAEEERLLEGECCHCLVASRPGIALAYHVHAAGVSLIVAWSHVWWPAPESGSRIGTFARPAHVFVLPIL